MSRPALRTIDVNASVLSDWPSSSATDKPFPRITTKPPKPPFHTAVPKTVLSQSRSNNLNCTNRMVKALLMLKDVEIRHLQKKVCFQKLVIETLHRRSIDGRSKHVKNQDTDRDAELDSITPKKRRIGSRSLTVAESELGVFRSPGRVKNVLFSKEESSSVKSTPRSRIRTVDHPPYGKSPARIRIFEDSPSRNETHTAQQHHLDSSQCASTTPAAAPVEPLEPKAESTPVPSFLLSLEKRLQSIEHSMRKLSLSQSTVESGGHQQEQQQSEVHNKNSVDSVMRQASTMGANGRAPQLTTFDDGQQATSAHRRAESGNVQSVNIDEFPRPVNNSSTSKNTAASYRKNDMANMNSCSGQSAQSCNVHVGVDNPIHGSGSDSSSGGGGSVCSKGENPLKPNPTPIYKTHCSDADLHHDPIREASPISVDIPLSASPASTAVPVPVLADYATLHKTISSATMASIKVWKREKDRRALGNIHSPSYNSFPASPTGVVGENNNNNNNIREHIRSEHEKEVLRKQCLAALRSNAETMRRNDALARRRDGKENENENDSSPDVIKNALCNYHHTSTVLHPLSPLGDQSRTSSPRITATSNTDNRGNVGADRAAKAAATVLLSPTVALSDLSMLQAKMDSWRTKYVRGDGGEDSTT